MEFSILCGCQVSLLIVHDNKLYEYSSHDMHQVLDEYGTYEKAHDSLSNEDYETNFGDKSKKKPERNTKAEQTPPKPAGKIGTTKIGFDRNFFCANPSPPSVPKHEYKTEAQYDSNGHYEMPSVPQGQLTPKTSELRLSEVNARFRGQLYGANNFQEDSLSPPQYHYPAQHEHVHVMQPGKMPNIHATLPQWPPQPHYVAHLQVTQLPTADNERRPAGRKRPREELRIMVPQKKHQARAPVPYDSSMDVNLRGEKTLSTSSVPVTPEFPSLTPTMVTILDPQRMPKKTSPLPLTPMHPETGFPSLPWTPTPKEDGIDFKNYQFESPAKRPCLSQQGYF